MFAVLFTYYGWQNANYVLNEVRNPVRTLKIAGPLGLGITATLYIFANIAYFAYVIPRLHLGRQTTPEIRMLHVYTGHLRRRTF